MAEVVVATRTIRLLPAVERFEIIDRSRGLTATFDSYVLVENFAEAAADKFVCKSSDMYDRVLG